MRTWYRVHFDETLGIEVKRCVNPDCTEKPINEFYKNGKAGYHGKCKKCEKVVNKTRYDTNPEKYREAVRKSARKYPERKRARMQRWENANKEYRKRYKREHRTAQREKWLAYDRFRHSKETPEFRHMWYVRRREYFQEYGKTNKERISENGRRWKQQHPDKHCDTQNRRRARKQNAPRVERIDRKAIIERDKWTCYLCLQICTPQNVTLDHVIPLFHGGSHTADNLRVACRPCNCSKGHKLQGFLA